LPCRSSIITPITPSDWLRKFAQPRFRPVRLQPAPIGASMPHRPTSGGTAEIGSYKVRLSPIGGRGWIDLQSICFRPRAIARKRRWSGMRHMTRNGPPIIGLTQFKNHYLNTKHGTLGGRWCADRRAQPADAGRPGRLHKSICQSRSGAIGREFIQRLATGREWHELESVVTAKEMAKFLSVTRCGSGTPRIVGFVLAVFNVVALAETTLYA
jgi:hypothetical protein